MPSRYPDMGAGKLCSGAGSPFPVRCDGFRSAVSSGCLIPVRLASAFASSPRPKARMVRAWRRSGSGLFSAEKHRNRITGWDGGSFPVQPLAGRHSFGRRLLQGDSFFEQAVLSDRGFICVKGAEFVMYDSLN